MKKFVSLLMTMVLLATMLTVFTVPAFAEVFSGNLSGNITYIKWMNTNGDVTIKSGASVTANDNMTINNKLIIEDGALLTVCGNLIIIGNLTIKPGGCLICTGSISVSDDDSVFEVGGICKGKSYGGAEIIHLWESFSLLPGGYMEMMFKTSMFATMFADNIKQYNPKVEQSKDADFSSIVIVGEHTHNFRNGACICGEPCPHEWENGKCSLCGYVCTHEGEFCANCGKKFVITEEISANPDTSETNPSPAGSTLSEGNLAIIVGIAAAVVFGLGGFFIGKAAGKKKKTAVAGAAESDE